MGVPRFTGVALAGVAFYRLAGVVLRARAQGARVHTDRNLDRDLQVSELVVDALQDGLVIFAPDGRIARVNAKMCELTGFSESELMGCSRPLPYWPEESVAELQAASDEVSRVGRGEYDVVLCRKNGERFPAIVTVGVWP